MKITKQQFDSLYSDDITKKQYDIIIDEIDKRFIEICEKFLHKNNKHGDSWYEYDNFSWNDENSNGFFDPKEFKEEIAIGGEWIDPPPGYGFSFPTRWLWEDFEEELNETSEKFLKEEKERKQKLKAKQDAKKERQAVLKNSIRSKLTPEELKIVKFK